MLGHGDRPTRRTRASRGALGRTAAAPTSEFAACRDPVNSQVGPSTGAGRILALCGSPAGQIVGGGESMRSRGVPRRWRRTLVRLCILVLAGPLSVSNVYHLLAHGHVGFGLHADVWSYANTSGVLGYSFWAVNLTPLPVPIRVCSPGPGFGSDPDFRWREEVTRPGGTGWKSAGSIPPTACHIRSRSGESGGLGPPSGSSRMHSTGHDRRGSDCGSSPSRCSIARTLTGSSSESCRTRSTSRITVGHDEPGAPAPTRVPTAAPTSTCGAGIAGAMPSTATLTVLPADGARSRAPRPFALV